MGIVKYIDSLNFYQKLCITFLIGLIIFWIALFMMGSKEGFYNYLYSFLFGLIPFFGGLIAMINAKMWGGFQSAVGRAVIFIGLGLFLWGSGENIWSYYNFFMGEPAPYPSLADLGFAPSIFFYTLGTVFLAKASGAKYGLRNKFAKIFLILAPIAILIMSYYVQIHLARGGILIPEGETLLKAILDIAYPLGNFLGLMIAVIVSGLSFKYLGGRYVFDISAIMLGLAVMYVGDSVFSYTTTTGTFYNGSFGDLILTLGLFFMTFGVLGFCSSLKEN
jgi:hypothetical protein